MNIFILDLDPKICAQYHCDKHVVKMIVETAQLLSTTHYIDSPQTYNEDWMYKPISNPNHPCRKWVGKSIENYRWLIELGLHLCDEYTKRYKKVHKTQGLIELLSHTTIKLPEICLTPFALAMDDKYKIMAGNNNLLVVDSYRNYYLESKFIEGNILKYKYTQIPNWLEMSLAKKLLELPKHSELRKRGEAFLSGIDIIKKPSIILSIKKGDIVVLKDDTKGKIVKYMSNKEIHLDMGQSQIKIVNKEDIISVFLENIN